MEDPLARSLELDRQRQLEEEAGQDAMSPSQDAGLERPLLGDSPGGLLSLERRPKKPRSNQRRLLFDLVFAVLFGIFGTTTLVRRQIRSHPS